MDEARVMEIWNPVQGSSGSGYLVGDDVVLTAHHVVDGVPMHGGVEVRQLDSKGHTDWLAAELVWLPETAASEVLPDADGALLWITAPDWRPPMTPPVRFGRIVGRSRVPCLGLGFPDAVARPDQARDTMPIRGHVDPLHGMKSQMTMVHIDVGIVPSRSGWRGSSGTGLLCGPHLIAVVTTEMGFAPGVLKAVPVSRLAELPQFEETLRAHGVHFVTEDIDGAAPDPDDELIYAPIAMPPLSLLHRLNKLRVPVAGGTLIILALLALTPPAAGITWPIGSTLSGILAGWGIDRLRGPQSAGPGREAAVRTLSEAIRGEVARRRRQLLGNDSKAINITFITVSQGGRDADTAWPRGDFDGIARYLDVLRPKRLVITGRPGSGKTLLAYEVVHRVLARKHYDGPVPVPVGLSEWDPSTMFTDWFTSRFAREYLDGAQPKARDLLASGRIMPVLDGLDEMDPPDSRRPRAIAALAQLNRFAGPLVLTCRSEEYVELSRADQRLLDCATVRIEEVEAVDGRRFMDERARNRARLAELKDDLFAPGTVTRTVLSSPWMLTLASSASQTEAGAERLRSFIGVSSAGRQEQEELRAALLAELIPSMCEPDPADRRRSYQPQAVTQWLRMLTAGLRGGHAVPAGASSVVSSRDLAIHTLWPIAGPRSARYAAAAITIVCWLPALLSLAACFQHNQALPLPGAVLLALLTPALLLSAWNARAPYVQPRRILFQRLRSRRGWSRIALGVTLGGVLMLPLTPLFGPGFALAAGAGFAVIFGLGLALSVRADIDRRHLVAVATPSALAVTAVTGFLAGRLGDFIGLTAGCGAGAIGLAMGVPAGLRAARRNDGGDPDPDPPGVRTPLSPLRNDAMAGVVSGVVVVALTLYGTLCVEWLRVPLPLAVFTALACGVAAGPGFVAVTSRQYLGLISVTRGKLPWRLAAFLRWCHERGLLRSAGTVYQVRHDELLEWLRR
ncbi:NACHT domain-containing protein [Streptomyces sp. NPDC056500]|uniref:NACHT domain-containing protein n=1 Tax=Streptomyces sp. NPDC056500 TaxID=3345840 RepID=UPI0036745796